MENCCPDINSIACNEVVSNAYLSDLISCMTNATGGTLTIPNGGPDHQPTRKEIEDSIGVAMTVSSNWADNVDGIVIVSSVKSDELVRKSEITGYCTSFRNLTLNGSSNKINECGGCVDTIYTLSFTQNVLTCGANGNITTSTNNGTGTYANCPHTWSTSGNGSSTDQNGKFCFDKNQVFSERTATQSLNVTWRNSVKSGSISYTQESRKEDTSSMVSKPYYTSVTVSVSPSNFGCNGGTANGTEYFTYAYEHRHYDTCGTYYESTYGHDSGSGSRSLGSKSHDCGNYTERFYSNTYYDKDGNPLSDSATATWSCSNCEDCPDENWYEPSSGSVDKCGVGTLSGRYYTKSFVRNDDGSCSETSTTSIEVTERITGCSCSELANETNASRTCTFFSDNLSLSLTQPAGPCNCDQSKAYCMFNDVDWCCEQSEWEKVGEAFNPCGPISAFTRSTDWMEVSAKTLSSGVVEIYARTKNRNTWTTETSGRTGRVFVAFDFGDGNGYVEQSVTSFVFNGHCNVCLCDCDDVTWPDVSVLEWEYGETGCKTITVTSTCGIISEEYPNNNFFSVSSTFEGNKRNIKVCVDGKNYGDENITDTLQLQFIKDDGTTCSTKTITLTAKSYNDPCKGKGCNDFSVASKSSNDTENTLHPWDGGRTLIGTYTTDCVTVTNVYGEGLTDFEWDEGDIYATLPDLSECCDNCVSSVTYTVTVSAVVDGHECEKNLIVWQKRNNEECPDKCNGKTCRDVSLPKINRDYSMSVAPSSGGTIKIAQIIEKDECIDIDFSYNYKAYEIYPHVGEDGFIYANFKDVRCQPNFYGQWYIILIYKVNDEVCYQNYTFNVTQVNQATLCDTHYIDFSRLQFTTKENPCPIEGFRDVIGQIAYLSTCPAEPNKIYSFVNERIEVLDEYGQLAYDLYANKDSLNQIYVEIPYNSRYERSWKIRFYYAIEVRVFDTNIGGGVDYYVESYKDCSTDIPIYQDGKHQCVCEDFDWPRNDWGGLAPLDLSWDEFGSTEPISFDIPHTCGRVVVPNTSSKKLFFVTSETGETGTTITITPNTLKIEEETDPKYNIEDNFSIGFAEIFNSCNVPNILLHMKARCSCSGSNRPIWSTRFDGYSWEADTIGESVKKTNIVEHTCGKFTVKDKPDWLTVVIEEHEGPFTSTTIDMFPNVANDSLNDKSGYVTFVFDTGFDEDKNNPYEASQCTTTLKVGQWGICTCESPNAVDFSSVKQYVVDWNNTSTYSFKIPHRCGTIILKSNSNPDYFYVGVSNPTSVVNTTVHVYAKEWNYSEDSRSTTYELVFNDGTTDCVSKKFTFGQSGKPEDCEGSNFSGVCYDVKYDCEDGTGKTWQKVAEFSHSCGCIGVVDYPSWILVSGTTGYSSTTIYVKLKTNNDGSSRNCAISYKYYTDCTSTSGGTGLLCNCVDGYEEFTSSMMKDGKTKSLIEQPCAEPEPGTGCTCSDSSFNWIGSNANVFIDTNTIPITGGVGYVFGTLTLGDSIKNNASCLTFEFNEDAVTTCNESKWRKMYLRTLCVIPSKDKVGVYNLVGDFPDLTEDYTITDDDCPYDCTFGALEELLIYCDDKDTACNPDVEVRQIYDCSPPGECDGKNCTNVDFNFNQLKLSCTNAGFTKQSEKEKIASYTADSCIYVDKVEFVSGDSSLVKNFEIDRENEDIYCDFTDMCFAPKQTFTGTYRVVYLINGSECYHAFDVCRVGGNGEDCCDGVTCSSITLDVESVGTISGAKGKTIELGSFDNHSHEYTCFSYAATVISGDGTVFESLTVDGSGVIKGKLAKDVPMNNSWTIKITPTFNKTSTACDSVEFEVSAGTCSKSDFEITKYEQTWYCTQNVWVKTAVVNYTCGCVSATTTSTAWLDVSAKTISDSQTEIYTKTKDEFKGPKENGSGQCQIHYSIDCSKYELLDYVPVNIKTDFKYSDDAVTTIECNDTDWHTIAIVERHCGFISATTTSSSFSEIDCSLDEVNNRYVVKARFYGSNILSYDRTIYVFLYEEKTDGSYGSVYAKRYELKQKPCPDPECQCSDVEWPSDTGLTWDANDQKEKTLTVSAKCGTVKVEVGTGFSASTASTTGGVTVKVKPTSTGSNKADLTLKFNDGTSDCTNTKKISLEQKSCSIEISASTTSLDCSGGTVTFKIVDK